MAALARLSFAGPLCAFAVWCLVFAVESGADPKLGKLQCVHLLVEEVSEAGKSLGLAEEDLHSAMLVTVRAKLPRLKVDTSCSNLLYLRVTLIKSTTEAGRPLGYSGEVELKLKRLAIILDTALTWLVDVWSKGGIIVGPERQTRSFVLDELDRYLTRFAADYYTAGNP